MTATKDDGHMWNERYNEPGYAYGTEPNDFLAAVAERIPPASRILSLAEGEGRNAVYLASKGHRVVAVDASAVGLAKAQQLARDRQVTIDTVVADLSAYVITPASWDAIVSIFCHLPRATRSAVLRQTVQGLRPGGILILEAYAPAQLALGTGGPRDPAWLASLSELKDDLEGMEFLHATETERTVIEGRYHTGRAAVVQILARRRPA